MQSRYQQLHLDSALRRSYDYAEACRELTDLLVHVYLKAPKTIQARIYEHVLTAFRLLAGLETAEQFKAADHLAYVAKHILPKQRKSVASSEYTQGAIAFNRRGKRNNAEKAVDFPFSADLLIHIFGFLDARSLIKASAVCRAWYEASLDDRLWRAQFFLLFRSLCQPSPGCEPGEANLTGCWRKAFQIARQGRPTQLFATNRAYCLVCRQALWLSEGPWVTREKKAKVCSHRRVRAMSASQVVTYIRGRASLSSTSSSSSSSDTDSEDERRPRARWRGWVY